MENIESTTSIGWLRREKLHSIALVTLVGCDLPGFSLPVGNVRVSLLILLAVTILLSRKILVDRHALKWFSLFILTTLPDVIHSEFQLRGLAYVTWLFVNFFSITCLFAHQFKADAEFVQSAMVSYRLQILISLALVAAGVEDRAHFLYYEASYFSIALIPFLSAVILNTGSRRWPAIAMDIGLVAAVMIASQSATLLIALVLIAVISYFQKNLLRSLISSAVFILLLCGLAAVYVNYFDDQWTRIINAVLALDHPLEIVDLLMDRGGNRIPRSAAALSVFIQHPVFGVGLGAYESASQLIDLSAYDGNIEDFMVEGKPPINIYIELLATGGVLALVGFLVFLFNIFRAYSARRYKSPQSNAVFVSLVATLLILNIEANYLRPCLWMILGCVVGSYSMRNPGSAAQHLATLES